MLQRRFSGLVVLNLTMNHISKIEVPLEMDNLRELILSDNKFKDIHPRLFSQLGKLEVLDLSLNQLSEISNLHHLKSLRELTMRGNKLREIQGLSQLQNLTILNLSFNNITKVSGLQNLKLLEVLELGKNYISDIDNLQTTANPLHFLQELYLYMNELRSCPPMLSFAQVKTLNFNSNPDLS